MEVIGLASLIALGMKLVSFIKYLKAKDVNGVITQAASWLAGVLVVFLASAAKVTAAFQILPGFKLGDLDSASKVLVGMMFLSAGSVIYDFKKPAEQRNEPALFAPAKTFDVAGQEEPPPPEPESFVAPAPVTVAQAPAPKKTPTKRTRTKSQSGHIDAVAAAIGAILVLLLIIVFLMLK